MPNPPAMRLAAVNSWHEDELMKEFFYDWLGLNEWIFKVLYGLNFPYLDSVWRVLSYGYSYWAVVLIVSIISIHYLKVRHSASEHQLEIMSELMAVLFIGFSFVWCLVYTFQNITLYLRPWMTLQDMVPPQSPLLWHEGFPGSASAISTMIACLFWRYASQPRRKALIAYVGTGCLLSVVAGVNWPVEVVAGVLVGMIGIKAARWYYHFGRKLVRS